MTSPEPDRATDLLKRASTRPGVYANGTETVDLILAAALDVLIEEGAGGFTLRRIAAKCDMKVGNLSYHFPRKEALIQLLLEELLTFYSGVLDDTVRQPGLSPEDRLRLMIEITLDDIEGKRTTHLFTELWAMANHNVVVAERVEAFYARAHAVLGQFIAELNPALTPDEVQSVALYISSSMEGTTPFLGHGKPWRARMGAIRHLSVKTLVTLARTVTSEDIAGIIPVPGNARRIPPADPKRDA